MRSVAVVVLATFITACGGGGDGNRSTSVSPPPPPVTFTASAGVAQKGPLILGSAITAQELGADLSPAGRQYTYQTNYDFGTFNPNSSFSSQYIGLNATGYYYDEVADAVSGGQVTLNSYADLSASSLLNVNLLTTLAYQRIQHLVSKSGLTFGAAQQQAEAEVLAALNVPVSSDYGSFTTLDISKGSEGDRLLAADCAHGACCDTATEQHVARHRWTIIGRVVSFRFRTVQLRVVLVSDDSPRSLFQVRSMQPPSSQEAQSSASLA
jgi:hypothetical protein